MRPSWRSLRLVLLVTAAGPVYIVSATALIVIVWVAMTLPWVRVRGSRPHATMVPRSMRRGR